MTKRSHKIIWAITLTTVLMAFGVQSYLTSMENSEAPDHMKDLLATDWRLRREPTRQVVEKVAGFVNDPDRKTSSEAYFARGLFLFYAQSDNAGAEKALRHAIDLNPKWSWPHDVLGIVLFRGGDQEAGLASIKHAMTLSPEWSRPYNDLARLYRLEKDWDKALEYARAAMAMDKDNPVPLYNYGVVLDYMGDRAGAQQVYLQVLELDAEIPAPYYNIACGYARDNNVDEALKHLSVALRLSPEFLAESTEDPDFDGIRADPKFIAFMERQQEE